MAHQDRISFVQTFSLIVGCLLLLTLTNTGVALAQNPVPLINQPLVPDAVNPGGAGFTLTVNGTGFVPGSVVQWNGSARATTFVSRSQVRATILSSDIANAHTTSVTVLNPMLGGATSNVVFFPVTRPSSSIALGPPREYTTGYHGAASVLTADVNGDRRLDLVVANSGSNTVSVLLGNGDGTFQPPVGYGVGSGPYSVAIGDFNGDGRLDLVVANNGSNDVSVLLGNGDGTFQGAVNYPGGSGPWSVAVGDFNGDGRLDVAVANYGSGAVSVFLGNGNGTFQPAVSYGGDAAQNATSVAVGDFNGDGKLDLIVTLSGPNVVGVLLGAGDGTFQPAAYYVAQGYIPFNPTSVAVGDFNGDGRLETAVSDDQKGAVSILLQVPTVSLSEVSLTFGNEVVGRSSASQTVTLSNTSGLALNISSIAVTGTNAADFRQADTCGSVLMPGGECTSTVTFAPTQTGPRTASVNITDDAVGSPQGVALNGTGVVLGPNATLSATSLTFATQLLSTTSPAQSVTLTNYGTAALSITRIGFTGADPTDFAQANDCGSSVAPGTSCTINVTFKPTGINGRAASLSITDNASGSQQTISLIGVSTEVELNPASMVFVVPPGQSASRSTTLTNVGSTTLSINGITLRGPGVFQLTNTCGSSVAAGKSCSITVTFRPPARGPYSADVYVYDNGGGSPQDVHLYGLGCSNIFCR